MIDSKIVNECLIKSFDVLWYYWFTNLETEERHVGVDQYNILKIFGHNLLTLDHAWCCSIREQKGIGLWKTCYHLNRNSSSIITGIPDTG